MAKKEAKTDLWVAKQLDECGIKYDPQGSTIKEMARLAIPSTSLSSVILCL